jgi:hypothetical protein
MGAMKDLYGKLVSAFPSTCPHCHGSLASSIDFNKLNEVIDEITLTERLNSNQGQLEYPVGNQGQLEYPVREVKANDYWRELQLEEQRLEERS